MNAQADPTRPLLESAREALGRGAWEEARDGFAAALSIVETPEALEGLGLAAWWLDDAGLVFDARERAYRLYHARKDRRGAGRVAMSLATDAVYFRGEPAIARGWLGRAREQLDGLDFIPEHGWLHVVAGDHALVVDGDPAEARRSASAAIALGDRLGDHDLIMVGRAIEGASLVLAGEVADGMPRLDQVATAALHGEVSDPFAIGMCCCYLMIACERVRDLERAAQWSNEIRRFCDQWRFNGVLAICRVQYAGVLISCGRWEDAERELQGSISQIAASRPPLRAEAVVRLASLRRRQGRLDDAAVLLSEIEGHPAALLERAALALDRDDPASAARLSERFTQQVDSGNAPDLAAGLELLVRAQAALGHADAATEPLARLETAAREGASPFVKALVSTARGVLAMAIGDHPAAVGALEDGVEGMTRAGAPFDAARTRVDLARALQALGDREGSARETTTALEALQSLGATRDAERAAALLRALEPPDRRAGTRADGLTMREVEVLRLVAQGHNNQTIARALFVSEFTIKRHVANILQKLDLPSRAAAAAYAVRKELL